MKYEEVTRSKIPFENIIAVTITACIEAWNEGDAFKFKRTVEMLEMVSKRNISTGRKKLRGAIDEERRKVDEKLEKMKGEIGTGKKKADIIFEVYGPFFYFILNMLEDAGLLLLKKNIPTGSEFA